MFEEGKRNISDQGEQWIGEIDEGMCFTYELFVVSRFCVVIW